MADQTPERRPILELGQNWADAELRGDDEALAQLLDDDFIAVGPLGFVLTKQGWLQRHREAALHYTSFDWTDLQVRDHGNAAIVVGIQTQVGNYQGNDASGQFRATQVLIRRDRPNPTWSIAALHLSAIAAPPRRS